MPNADPSGDATGSLTDAEAALARDRIVIAAALLQAARERDAAWDEHEATALRAALAVTVRERNEAFAQLADRAAMCERVGAELLAATRQRDALAAELYRLSSRAAAPASSR